MFVRQVQTPKLLGRRRRAPPGAKSDIRSTFYIPTAARFNTVKDVFSAPFAPKKRAKENKFFLASKLKSFIPKLHDKASIPGYVTAMIQDHVPNYMTWFGMSWPFFLRSSPTTLHAFPLNAYCTRDVGACYPYCSLLISFHDIHPFIRLCVRLYFF